MSSEFNLSQPQRNQTTAHQGADGGDRIQGAADFIRCFLSRAGTASGPPGFTREEIAMGEWAASVGLLLNTEEIFPRLLSGGMEHDVFPVEQRLWKVTKGGIFGFTPGLELHLESHGGTRKTFHLWEATPLEYLERIRLHNLLVPGINVLEGVLFEAGSGLAVVTSQPLLQVTAETIVSDAQIETWFAQKGFSKITHAAYYRAEDNLAIFDAHAKNVVRDGAELVPFDIIPCSPKTGFLDYIQGVLQAGEQLRVVRTTTNRSP